MRAAPAYLITYAAAAVALAKTGNVHAVAAAFGWSSIETANHYAVVMDDTLDAIAAAVI